MDNYSIEDVKNIVDNDNLSFYILSSILENTTRRIEIYGDEECIEILRYILDNADISYETRMEINKYLNEVDKSLVNSSDSNKSGSIWLIIIIVLIIICFIFFIFK